jgi:large subunit ribosomal protein L23
MKNLYDVIRRPLITEKTTTLKETQRNLCFEVHRDATKPEIKKAVETLFSVKVAEVRVANVHGKVKRQGRYAGRRPDWKKAYVVLAKGEKMVEFFDQAG